MALALFDLDNTLIAGDSDHLWGDFLVEKGAVDGDDYKRTNDQFYQDYLLGRLDILAYLRFALAALARQDMSTLNAWHAEFMNEKIRPILLPKAFDLIEQHRARGDELVIITATNDFVTRPIAVHLGIHNLIATVAEQKNGRYTGEIVGTPCYREGKVVRLQEWLDAGNQTLEEATFYSDSHNDIPLLERVTHPVAVDPDPVLSEQAAQRGWATISLRN